MKARNLELKKVLGRMSTPEIRKELDNLPTPDTCNLSGHEAYGLPEEFKLLSMLNTLKLEPQFYRSVPEQLVEIQRLVENVASRDPYFVAQAIVYSRCMRPEGLRTINHLAAALLSPYIRGFEWSKRFFSGWDKRAGKGGCIYRLDDMSEIKDIWAELNPRSTGKHKNKSLPNAMKKGFASVLENADSYLISKYKKKAVVDIANLVHPNIAKCKGTVKIDGESMVTIDALMRGFSVLADTHETANSEAGQLVAAAKRAGTVNELEAKELLDAAKASNWDGLLKDHKLGILAALRNIRNILSVCKDVTALCNLLSDGDLIIKGKIMPYQIDTAYEVVSQECEESSNKRKVLDALERGYVSAVPNLARVCTGRNLVILDCSGSMRRNMRDAHTGRFLGSCIDKAGLIAATIVQATGADCIRFGTSAEYAEAMNGRNLFEYKEYLGRANMGCTNLAKAFELITEEGKVYDRIFILSDYECNCGKQAAAYANYIRRVNSPYIYSVDLEVYGSAPLKNREKVFYYYGYGYGMFTDIAKNEFRPEDHIAEVRKIVI